jgi:hypothetical protein
LAYSYYLLKQNKTAKAKQSKTQSQMKYETVRKSASETHGTAKQSWKLPADAAGAGFV